MIVSVLQAAVLFFKYIGKVSSNKFPIISLSDFGTMIVIFGTAAGKKTPSRNILAMITKG